MARPGPTKRLAAALEELRSLDKGASPLDPVALARRIREAAEELEAAKVDEARAGGVSWREIGLLYGMSKQAAHQRFGSRMPSDGHAGKGERERAHP